MRPVVIDFETTFGDDYSLSKMSTEAYIRDQRFKAHGAAIKWDAVTSPQWYDERELQYILKEEDWSDVFLIAHHMNFDGFILSHHYNVVPQMYGCTLGCARLLLGNHISVSLDSVRKHYGMAAKKTPYHLFKNKTWDQLTQQVREELAAGACDEVQSIWDLMFNMLAPQMPNEEWDVVDSLVRMFTQPVLRADTAMLGKLWADEETRKADQLRDLGYDLSTDTGRAHAEAQLQSADRFADLLRAEGVEPETKDGKKGPIYAFAKTDNFMQDYLLEHENPRVRALTQARLGVKSTILQTRAETYGWMASRGAMPVYLRYAGAGTLRPSGGDGGNWLNLKRGSALRRAICAPDGYLLAPVDSSQIECRVLHYLAGGADDPVIQKFRRDEDPYVDLASQFYGEQIYKPEKDDPRKLEMESKRGMGKQGRLMCLGPDTLVLTDVGAKRICNVQRTDRLWDGIEWVEHQGLISQGKQNTINVLRDVWLTAQHLVLCGDMWLPASRLNDESIAFQALASGSANLPLQDTKSESAEASSPLWLHARVERPSIQSTSGIFSLDALRAAIGALNRLPVIGPNSGMAMPMFAQMIPIADGSYQELLLSTRDALPKTPSSGTAMVGGASSFIRLGCGVRSDFLNTCSRLKAGINRSWNWIAETTIEAMFQVICASSLKKKTTRTKRPCASSKKQLLTYDLSYAGPRNRFTILSSRGPVIVHNCGYGASGKMFKATAKNGQYGPPVEISLEDSNDFVQLYRDTNPSICAKGYGYWAQAGRMLSRLADGEPAQWGPLYVADHRIYVGPGRLPMIYDTLEYFTPEPEEAHLYKEFEQSGFWRLKTRYGWKTMWGSKLVQNICEGVSRAIVSQAMTRIKRQYGIRTLNWPYDELLLLIPRDGHEDKALENCLIEMKRTPDWLPGLPLNAEGHCSDRYEK